MDEGSLPGIWPGKESRRLPRINHKAEERKCWFEMTERETVVVEPLLFRELDGWMELGEGGEKFSFFFIRNFLMFLMMMMTTKVGFSCSEASRGGVGSSPGLSSLTLGCSKARAIFASTGGKVERNLKTAVRSGSPSLTRKPPLAILVKEDELAAQK